MSSSEGSFNAYDEEKGPAVDAVKVTEAKDFKRVESGPLAKLWDIVLWLDEKFGVEVRGVERVPESERHHYSIMDAGWLWMSANMTISTVSLGTLSNSIYGMGLTDAALVIVFFNLLCTLPVGLFSTWGMQSGLRQMMIGRFSFGWLWIYFPVLLNCLACLGWSCINSIAGAQALAAVAGHDSPHKLPVAVGIVIIAIVTMFVALFGYRYVHLFERYASIPVFVILCILLGQAAPHVTASISPPGTATAASCLSYGATVAGFALGWTSLAADYTVNFPADSSKVKVFFYTYTGLNLPLIFCEVIGAVLMHTFEKKPSWEQAYNVDHFGGLLGAPLTGPMGGFGKFLLVILAMSIVANNIPNMYSFALTFQTLGSQAQKIPRMFLVILGTGIYIAVAIPGASSFEDFLDLMLVILSYWLAIYSCILIEEFFIFRQGSFTKGFDLERYNDLSALPIGLAAFGATAIGACGAVLGMAQVWWIGPIAKAIEPKFGADIGFLLSFGFSGVAYPPLRYLERKYFGK
ncbi:Purine-cytosine permease fcy21 [Microbotryomycetes sp. JL201]|nr:Purine-cytosine permease fcy21 [Microbotryomycetes sp. JL201]